MILRGAVLLDFGTLARREGLEVQIAGGRIRRIVPQAASGPQAGFAAAEADPEILDCSGLYLIPGLVNTHSHTAMTLLRGAAEDCTVQAGRDSGRRPWSSAGPSRAVTRASRSPWAPTPRTSARKASCVPQLRPPGS